MSEEERHYREFGVDEFGVFTYQVKIETTDLLVRTLGDFSKEAFSAALEARRAVETHGRKRPEFLTSFSPLRKPKGRLHPVVSQMYLASRVADVGPMAAVAGAVAEAVARALKPLSTYVAVENGGDVFIIADKEVTIGLWAGNSPFTGKIGLVFDHCPEGISVCTSSATVGPSISFGVADAATVVARSGALADAAASALGNRVQGPDSFKSALTHAMTIQGVLGALAIVGVKIGGVGDIRLTKI